MVNSRNMRELLYMGLESYINGSTLKSIIYMKTITFFPILHYKRNLLMRGE